jgi:hypothetical protein
MLTKPKPIYTAGVHAIDSFNYSYIGSYVLASYALAFFVAGSLTTLSSASKPA